MCFETYLNIASIIRLKKLQEVQAEEEKLCVGGGDSCQAEFCWADACDSRKTPHTVRAKNIKDDLCTSGG